jgi:hypothetical protein
MLLPRLCHQQRWCRQQQGRAMTLLLLLLWSAAATCGSSGAKGA